MNRAVKQEPRIALYACVQGLAALRAGEMETARRAALGSERLPWGDASILNMVALSLIDLREGHDEMARTRFDRAKATLNAPPRTRPAGRTIHLVDWLEFQVLRPQIEGPLVDRVFPTDVFIH
jgi:hypothetical protein